MKEAYICFDKDAGDDFVTAGTFGTVLRALGQNPNEAELKQIMSKYGDKVSCDEFLALFPTLDFKDPISDDDMNAMWEVFGGGDSISLDDFKKGLQAMGDKITDAEFDKLTQQQKLAGTISKEQFNKIMNSQNEIMNPK